MFLYHLETNLVSVGAVLMTILSTFCFGRGDEGFPQVLARLFTNVFVQLYLIRIKLQKENHGAAPTKKEEGRVLNLSLLIMSRGHLTLPTHHSLCVCVGGWVVKWPLMLICI